MQHHDAVDNVCYAVRVLHGLGGHLRDDERVRPTTGREAVDVREGAFTYTFPAHSLTILRIPVRAGS